MLSLLESIILGLIQGATEFLPISSTGHLVLTDKILGFNSSFEFDVLLNIGTILALLIFYRKTLLELIVNCRSNIRVFSLIIEATVPAVVIGYIWSDLIENKLQSAWVVVFMLIAIGLLMIWLPGRSKGKPVEELSLNESRKIGIAQALALIPGTSRSGITILAGQSQGLNSVESARFSFLMAIPIISGATLKVALSEDGRNFISTNTTQLFFGNLASFLAGLLAVNFLIDILGKKGLKPFGWYRICLGIVLAVLLFAKII